MSESQDQDGRFKITQLELDDGLPPKRPPAEPHTVTIDPVTRIEGHLKVKVVIGGPINNRQVIDAWSTGTLFRGVEKILQNRHPWDAVPITQRVCGVCPVSHGMAAVKTIDDATGAYVPSNGRVLRNIVLGANFVQSHILHFYHLAVLDYIAGPQMAPWDTCWDTDRRIDAETTEVLVGHYVTALEMRRKAHEVGAIFGGRMPHPPAYVPGGFTSPVTAQAIDQAQNYLAELVPFIEQVYLPDVQLLGSVYDDYYSIGAGVGNLLAYGVFDLDAAGQNKLLDRGQISDGALQAEPVDLDLIREDVTASWYDDATGGLHPADGDTIAQYPKEGAYSWLKSPRYNDLPYEVGPLARMWVSGRYQNGISVMDRHLARAEEALLVAQAMVDWVDDLQVGASVYQHSEIPLSGSGCGLTEAPRGALGHWMDVGGGQISRYQIITPTCWNASPRDSAGVRGPLEEALVGTPIGSQDAPIEVLRIIHAFDPCLSCAVHVMRPDDRSEVVILAH